MWRYSWKSWSACWLAYILYYNVIYEYSKLGFNLTYLREDPTKIYLILKNNLKKTAHTLKITFNLGFEETLQEGFKNLKFSIINFFFYFKLQILQTTRETSNILNPWQIHYDSFYLQSNQWDKAMVFDFFSIWTAIRNSIFQTGQLLAHCTVFWNVDFFWSFVDLTFQFGDNVAGDVSEPGLVPGAPWWTPVAVWGPQWG